MRAALLSVIAAVSLPMSVMAAEQQTNLPASLAAEERHVDGTVQFQTPDEIVLSTVDGVRHFAITAETQQPIDVAQGDDVELWYLPAENGKPERVTRMGARSAMTAQHAVKPPAETAPVQAAALSAPQHERARRAEPSAPPTTVAMAMPATPPSTTTATQPKRLPKTASDLPLIGLLGIASLTTSAVLRRTL